MKTGEILMPTPTEIKITHSITMPAHTMAAKKKEEEAPTLRAPPPEAEEAPNGGKKEHEKEDGKDVPREKIRSRSNSKSKCSTTRSGLNTPRIMPPSREPPVRQELKMGVCVPMFDV
jgi:hypothetical protein